MEAWIQLRCQTKIVSLQTCPYGPSAVEDCEVLLLCAVSFRPPLAEVALGASAVVTAVPAAAAAALLLSKWRASQTLRASKKSICKRISEL